MEIRHVQESDHAFWVSLDQYLSKDQFMQKARDKMGYILLVNEEPVGLLRYNLFWDEQPFLYDALCKKRKQRAGYGKAMMRFWEQEMQQRGYKMLLTSTQVDEEAQHFYRKLGYQDAGSLLINVPEYQQPMELFLLKRIAVK